MATEKRTRLNYSEEFKRDAVALVRKQGYRVSQAAFSLGIRENLLRRWRREFEGEISGEQLNRNEREELRRLRKKSAHVANGGRDFKKSQSELREVNEVKYRVIREQAGRWLVVGPCQLLGVLRSCRLWLERRSVNELKYLRKLRSYAKTLALQLEC
jgi:transposase